MDRHEEITDMVCQHYGITLEEIKSESRLQRLVKPRHIAIYLIRCYTPMTMEEISTAFDLKHHTSVSHACKRAMTFTPDELVRRCHTLLNHYAHKRMVTQSEEIEQSISDMLEIMGRVSDQINAVANGDARLLKRACAIMKSKNQLAERLA